jgi:hypothetical protein
MYDYKSHRYEPQTKEETAHTPCIFDDVSKNLNHHQSGNVAHLSGFGLQEKQGYYFTSTQEENANDRTVRLYVVSIYPDERIEKFAFTILGVSGKWILLAGPPEMQPRNLVLALEAQ